ncbi:MAG: hypothetical protein ACK5MP_13770 [Nostocoides sp.]
MTTDEQGRDRRRPPRRTAIAVLLAGLILPTAPSGCGSDQQEVTVGHWQLHLSQEWKPVTPYGGKWTAGYERDGVTLRIAGDLGDDTDANSVLTDFVFASSSKDNWQNGRREDREIPNAYSSGIQRASYDEADGSHVQAVWVAATQWPYPASAALAFYGTSIDETLVQDVVDDARWISTTQGSTG